MKSPTQKAAERGDGMSATPETDAKKKLKDMIGDEYVSAHFARKLERERDEATERIQHAEILLGDLAGGYWRAVLNDQDPSGEGIMGERVQQYWARYSENATVEAHDQ